MQHTWVMAMALKINDTIRATRVGGRRPLSAIRAIVFHYTANTGLHATALGNARYFANGSEGRAASAHFVVDEGDTVYQCVPLDVVAWAVGDGAPIGLPLCLQRLLPARVAPEIGEERVAGGGPGADRATATSRSLRG